MIQDELKIILEKHGKWLRDENGGERANLTWANLTRANLTGADLTGADLTWANLTRADLTGANLIVIHPGTWEMIVSKTHIHIGCERFPNDKKAEATMRILAKRHKAQDFLRLYIESLKSANKLMKLSAAAAKKEKCK